MQFSIAAAAFMATAVMATAPISQIGDGQIQATTAVAVSSAPAVSTVQVTVESTVTSCAASITDCPARSTKVHISSYASVVTASSVPLPLANTSAPVVPAAPATFKPSYVTPAASAPATTATGASGAATSPAPVAPLLSTMTISSCVPTVIYSTVTVAAPTVSSAAGGAPGPVASGTGSIAPAQNVTSPAATGAPVSPSGTPFTGAASGLQASFGFAAVAGAAAFFLA